jgi:hypothetical protein
MRAAAKGEALDDGVLQSLVSHALDRGPEWLSKLTEIVDAQRASFGLAQDDARLGRILDRLASAAFTGLRDLPRPDRRAAMQSMLAAGDTLGLGFSTSALYLNFHFEYERANGFTNESGLPDLIGKIDATGGAAVGVGGAIFDIGSTGSDMIVSVDASSLIADCIHTFTAILLAVDELAQRRHWDDEHRADEVRLRLTRGSHPETIAELERMGLPGRLRDSLPKILDALAKKLAGETNEAKPIPQDLWCRSDRQAERVAHLTRLALEGRIVALTADLADPRVGERVNALLRAHGTTAKVVHFSNALDYIADIRGACRNFGAIDLHPDAVLTTSCSWILKEPLQIAQPDGYTLVDMLGTSEKPKSNAASAWLGPNKLGDLLHQAAWDTPQRRRDLVQWTKNLLMLNDDYAEPLTVEQYKETVDRMVHDAFAHPAAARDKLNLRLFNLGRMAAYELVEPSPLEGIHFALPKSFADLVPVADQIDAQFWSRGDRKVRFLHALLEKNGIDPRTIGDLKQRAAVCRTYDDLRDLELALRSAT